MSDKLVLVCTRVLMGEPLLLEDNLTGPCATCGVMVQYRPHAPTPHELRCTLCFAMLMKPGDEMMTTPRMVEDVDTYFRRQKH